MIGRFLFRAILVIVGAVSAYVSINVAFGGLHTLGWQGATDYVTVTDDATYALGAFLILAATNPQRFRGGLALAFALVSVGGLARLTQLQPDVTFGSSNLLSAVTALVIMPAMFVWLWRTPKVSPAADR